MNANQWYSLIPQIYEWGGIFTYACTQRYYTERQKKHHFFRATLKCQIIGYHFDGNNLDIPIPKVLGLMRIINIHDESKCTPVFRLR